MESAAPTVETSGEGDRLTVRLVGRWTIREAADAEGRLRTLSLDGARQIVFDLSRVSAIDTAGAWLLERTADDLQQRGIVTEITGIAVARQPLIDLVQEAKRETAQQVSIPKNHWIALVEHAGRATVEIAAEGRLLLSFYGLATISLFRTMLRPRRLRLVSLVNQIEKTGIDAIPIVCLLSFLIGITLTFVAAEQLRQFGAEIFTVNLLGVVILREIGVLLTAILVAGRSGSAFTAEIGTMQVNEEVDALRTLGIDPVEVLVLPRINGLLVSLPVLVLLAEASGLAGGALICVVALGFTLSQFLQQLASVVTLEHFFVGMIKAPIFAYIIALVGCYQGLRVTGSAESVGRLTTRSVVTSIFLVIVADAVFAVIFSIMRI